MDTVKPHELPRYLLSHGKHTITVSEAASLLGLSHRSAIAALSRLGKRGGIFSPAKGLYVVVPPEYMNWGAPPALWFIDPLMEHLKQRYYVALLSAASAHHAAHQAPQIFQVMVKDNAFVRNKTFGRARIRFYSNPNIADDPTEKLTVPTGYASVSTKETTVVDLVSKPRLSGGLNNVATILREIGELNGADLARVAARRDRSTVRRVGWLVETFGVVDEIEALRQAARVGEGTPTPLAAWAGRRGSVDKRWSVRVNVTVEPDL
jgi:predicted transcriptional regulator of viral defense system